MPAKAVITKLGLQGELRGTNLVKINLKVADDIMIQRSFDFGKKQ